MADEFMEMLFRVIPARVTRKEYDALFLAMTRLTDRIEALENPKYPQPPDDISSDPWKVAEWYRNGGWCLADRR